MLMIQLLGLMGVNLMDNGIIVISRDGNVVEKEIVSTEKFSKERK